MRAYDIGLRGHLARSWLYILAALVMLFLVTPTLIVVPMSFSESKLLRFPPETLSLTWYRAYFDSALWMSATRLTLIVASLTALTATLLGTAAAWGIARLKSRWEPVLLLVLTAPMMAPVILLAIGIFYVYARLGLVSTITGLVLAHTLLAIPFVITVVMSRLRSFDFDQIRAANVSGAGPVLAFFTIALPQLRVSIFISGLLAFLTSLDEVVVALFISGGGRSTRTKVMFSNLRDRIDPTIAAVSTLLIGVTLVAVIIMQILEARQTRFGERSQKGRL